MFGKVVGSTDGGLHEGGGALSEAPVVIFGGAVDLRREVLGEEEAEGGRGLTWLASM